MAEQERAGAGSPERHTESPGRAAAMPGAEAAAADSPARSGPQPDERSGIQWWETCGGWNVRYAMGTF